MEPPDYDLFMRTKGMYNISDIKFSTDVENLCYNVFKKTQNQNWLL